jgi:Ser/Thr protein kinase RdoA (MazF antagonist)
VKAPEQLAAVMPESARIDCLLRAGAMRAYLAATLCPDDPDAPCHVLDAKYVPGEQCTVLYALGERLVSARLWLDAAELGPRLWVFPDDPALPGLRLLATPDDLRDALRVALPEGPQVRGCRATLLRYRPHRRATFLLRVRLGSRLQRYVGKAYHDEEKATAVYTETRRLARVLAGGGIVVGGPVAFLPTPRLVLQQVVEGQPLDQLLGDRRGRGRGLRSAVRGAATALAALHSAPHVSTRERPVAAELARFRQRAAAVSSVNPGLGARLLAVAEDLDRCGRHLPPEARRLVHGDCKPSQFLLRPGEVALVDFDHCGVADPACDVGTFLASLRQRMLSGAAAPGAHELSADFLAAYERVAGDGITTQARWYEAVALMRKALRAFARAPRSPLPAALVAEARRCLTAMEEKAA